MKGDIYYLKREKDGEIIAKVEMTTDVGFIGQCYYAVAWNTKTNEPEEYQFFANIYCKFDGCTHWNFYGEDYDPEYEADSYYHICGTGCFTDHIRLMCFVWKLASVIATNRNTDWIQDYYFDDSVIGNLIDLMLDGYVIEKETKNAETNVSNELS